jgi:hypothetical protein
MKSINNYYLYSFGFYFDFVKFALYSLLTQIDMDFFSIPTLEWKISPHAHYFSFASLSHY